MRLYLPRELIPANQFQRSYIYYAKRQLPAENVRDLYNTQWEITMPGKEPNDPPEVFITIRAISVVAAEVISGRATIVWEAVRRSEMKAGLITKVFSVHLVDVYEADAMIQIYVIKQAWSPYNVVPSHSKFIATPSEPELYARLLKYKDAEKHTVKVFLAHEVYINGRVDSTVESIRRGLEIHDMGLTDSETSVEADYDDEFSDPETGRPKRLRQRERRSRRGPGAIFADTMHLFEFGGAKDRQIVSRVLSRIVMETWGWPLKYFLDELELLMTVRDLITGEQASS